MAPHVYRYNRVEVTRSMSFSTWWTVSRVRGGINYGWASFSWAGRELWSHSHEGWPFLS
jgi:hypothetical protein